jgi:hypothetical protein
MIDHHSILTLIAELAVAVVGFAGVAAAFGGRDRAYLQIEIDRLKALFSFAFIALTTSLFALSLTSFSGFGESSAFWSSAVGASLHVPTEVYFLRAAYRNVVDPDSSTGLLAASIVVVGTTLAAVLYLASLAVGGHWGLLEMALSTQILFAVWVFVRLLIHRT